MSDNSDNFMGIVVKGEVINSLFIIITKPFILINSLLIASFLSLNDYGIYKLIMASYLLISGFSANFLDNLILNEMNIFHGNQEESKARKIFKEYSLAKLLVGAILCVLVYYLSGFIGWRYTSDISKWIEIIAFLFLVENIKNVILIYFQYKLKFFISSFFVFSIEAIKLISVLICYFFFSFGITSLIFIIVLSNFLMLLLSLPLFFRNLRDDNVFSGGNQVKKSLLLETLFYYGKWVVIRSYFISFTQNIRPWVIKLMIGTEAVAIFSIAADFADNIKSVVSLNAVKIFLPRKLNDKENLRKMYALTCKYVTYFFIVASILGILFIPLLIKYFIPKYISSVPYFYIVIFSSLFFGIASVSNKMLYTLRKQKELTLITSINAIFIVVFNIIFTPFFGLYGVSLELLMNQILLCLISHWMVTKYMPNLKFFLDDFYINHNDKILLRKGLAYAKENIKKILVFYRRKMRFLID